MKINNLLQRKPIYIALSIIVGLTVAWYALYYPTKHKIKILKKQLVEVENQIHEIESSVTTDKSVREEVKSLVEKFHRLENKFPAKEEEAIGLLSDYARSFNIEIVSVNAQPKTFYLDSNEQKIQIEDKVCRKCFVTIEMNGSYADIIQYIEEIEEKLPAYFSVERLKINKASPQSTKLDVNLGITLYLLS